MKLRLWLTAVFLMGSIVFPPQARSAQTDLPMGAPLNASGARASVPDDVYWDSRFTMRGLDGTVKAIATSGSSVYVVGHFVTAEDVVVNRIAQWNVSTNRWSALGQGLGCGVSYCAPYATAIAVSGNQVYVGGMFTTAGGVSASSIAVWNGSAWSALGSGVDGIVNAIGVSGNDVYVGGYFTTAGGISAHNIAKWNSLTNTWSSLNDGISGGSVHAIAISGSDVYAGGQFNAAGGVAVTNLAKWNGSVWSDVGGSVWNSSGHGATVTALAVNGSDLYVGGTFDSAGGLAVHNLAKWNGSIWSDVGGGISNWFEPVKALAANGGDLYVGGSFYHFGGLYFGNIAKWDGSNWSDLGYGTNGAVYAVAVNGNAVYAGGYFTRAGDTSANYIAKWNKSTWSSLGNRPNNSMDGDVYAIAVNGNDVYVGGDFCQVGNVSTCGIAKWNVITNAWSAVGGGGFRTIYALAVNGNDVYIGSNFWGINGIAKWDGSRWSALGGGVNGNVYGIAISGNDVYVVGSFTTAGGMPANSVAKWNGNSWSGLGSGIDNSYPRVYAVAVSGGRVYIGGSFESFGGASTKNIAQWNGSSWSAVGTSGVGSPNWWSQVRAIVTIGNDVYVGGSFSSAKSPQARHATARNAPGGIVVSNIAKWNGSAWSEVGGGVDGDVYAMATDGSNIYVGGFFTLAGDVDANRVALWDGSKWSPLGSGVDGCGYYYCAQSVVQAIAVSASGVYVGGKFSTAGNKPSHNFGRWTKNLYQFFLPFVWK